MTNEKKTVTDFEAGTLSDEDREGFLRSRGLVPGIAPEAEARLRVKWPDEDILEAMAVGLG